MSLESVGLVLDDCFLEHETGPHPENPSRLQVVSEALREAGLFSDEVLIPTREVEDEMLFRVHTPAMVRRVRQLAFRGGGRLDSDTVVSPGSEKAARKAVGAGLAAVDSVRAGKNHRVMCLVRPPGHHATPARSMGFCLFNNIAIAAAYLLDKGDIEKVAIIDFDVHHGNGTQDCFYDRGDVYFVSLHQWPHYPGTGLASEKGTGEGLGTTLNFPLPGGVSPQTWFDRFREGLEAVHRFNPDFVLVSAGFDSHREDPLGDFPLGSEDYGTIAEMLCDLAGDCGMVSFLEGGYNLGALARSVVAYLQGHH